MSQLNLHEIICQQQEQLVAMQVQIQALLAERTVEGEGEGAREIGKREGAKVAKPQIFNGTAVRVVNFIIACKLYIRMRMREEPVEGVKTIESGLCFFLFSFSFLFYFLFISPFLFLELWG